MIFLRFVLRMFVFGFLGALWLVAGVYLYLSPNLPDVETLRDVKLQTPMLVYTRDGDLIGQFGEQKRSPLPFDDIPPQFINALLAAEDDNYFAHRGIDVMGLMRATSELVLTGEKGSGGSTLTMQVARNYFLSLDRTFMRKFNEILLAIEIERSLSKEEIFELYFNRIFLGHRSYGFEAASQVYYGKTIGELSLAQHAMLAGIPKAPSRINPVSGPQAGLERRNWILGRMYSLGYINEEDYLNALAEPVTARLYGAQLGFAAHYAAEMARQEMVERYGLDAYTNGYHVYTTIDSELQRIATRSVVEGLIAYDKRHGYRGPERHLPPKGSNEETIEDWRAALRKAPEIGDLEPAIVTSVADDKATLLLGDGSTPDLPWENGIRQARPYLSENSTGASQQPVSKVLAVGDLIRVTQDEEGAWQLAQLPAAQAALVSLNPDNGAIISIVGGIGFEQSKFNRATQAQRQPGSNFKPFLYAAALDAGFTAATIINDAPIVLEGGSQDDLWRPENDEGKFYGPTRLRWALTKSRNLVSIRLLQRLGVKRLIKYANHLGFDTSGYVPELSLALGTQSITPLELAKGYAVLANGGFRVEPYLIERIEDINGLTIFDAMPPTVCRDCDGLAPAVEVPTDEEMSMEEILATDTTAKKDLPPAPRVMDARVNFIIDSILKDVITRGTGRRALVLERSDIGGKTGTTNGPMDVWFSGYNRDVVTTAWVGFDNYTPLGRREFGGTAALPIWISYMREALKDSPEQERPVPPGIVTVKIDPVTGEPASPGQSNAIFEYFKRETAPQHSGRRNDRRESDSSAYDQVNDLF
ncbi:Penicillin-binding protein 1A [Halioglobus japonicus]|nr:Penicillin-binding protein 1A [Halioglobus japonicus]